MKVLFLGCGYLGYNLAMQFKQSHDVLVYGLESIYSKRMKDFVVCDVFQEGAFDTIDMEDAIVVDTTALIMNQDTNKDEEKTISEVVFKYQQLFDTLASKKIRQFVFLSSGGTVYGDQDEPISEECLLHPETLYAKCKVALEQTLMSSKLNYLILRLGNPYGGFQDPHKNQGVIPILIQDAFVQKTFQCWNRLDSKRDYIYITDFASALDLLLQHQVKNEIVNVGSGKNATLEEVMDYVEESTGQVLQVQMISSTVKQIQSICLDITKLKELTGFSPCVSLQEGIQHEVDRILKEDFI